MPLKPLCAWCGKLLTQTGMQKAGRPPAERSTIERQWTVAHGRTVTVGWHADCAEADPVSSADASDSVLATIVVRWVGTPYIAVAKKGGAR